MFHHKPNNIPQGFWMSGVHSGIAKSATKNDLAVFLSEVPARAAAVFTSNRVKAAPVLLSQKHIQKSGQNIKGIVANSGCANACTGARGFQNARRMSKSVSSVLNCSPTQMLVASTGVIGAHLPIVKIEQAIGKISNDFFCKSQSLEAIKAIMTTDTRPKYEVSEFIINNKKVKIWGCVKGAGMIHPRLIGTSKKTATMLSFILTDADGPQSFMQTTLEKVVNMTFNRISVDGDTSTNDTVFLLANGMSGARIDKKQPAERIFAEKLHGVCDSSSRQLVADGEGANHIIKITVDGARTEKDALRLAEVIATSPLVKTAFHGADANWGRILAAMGRAGVFFNPSKVDVFFGEIKVCSEGQSVAFSENKVRKILRHPEIFVGIHLNQGLAKAHYFTCDMSLDYIKIDASYRS